MSLNTFGHILKMHSFGESHGPALGVVLDGVPSNMEVDLNLLNEDLLKRRPGQSQVVTSRQEPDQFEILSGVFEGKTLGTPITVIVRNKDQRSSDYNEIKNKPRVGHADDTWKSKFSHVDHRGGGRSSGRETLSRVIAGSFAKMILKKLSPETEILPFTRSIGPIEYPLNSEGLSELLKLSANEVYNKPTRFPIESLDQQAQELLVSAKEEGQSYGGQVQVLVKKPPANLGQPVFHKLKSDLAMAQMSLGATQSFELGLALDKENTTTGTDFHTDNSHPIYGGIRGGISTGETIAFSVKFKPTSSLLDVSKKGRHDPCIVPRALPVVEAMTAWVLADHLLLSRVDQI